MQCFAEPFFCHWYIVVLELCGGDNQIGSQMIGGDGQYFESCGMATFNIPFFREEYCIKIVCPVVIGGTGLQLITY